MIYVMNPYTNIENVIITCRCIMH